MDHILQTARQAANVGGEVLTSFYQGAFEIRNKAIADMVSDADVQSQQSILAHIRDRFPSHAFLGEEDAGDHSQTDWQNEAHLWVVDPLDGTTNFVHGIPHFAVSIGYYEHGVGKVGVVYNPVTQQCFTAVQGHGAKHGLGALSEGDTIHVNDDDALDQVLVGVGFYYDRGELMQRTLAAVGEFFGQNIHGIRRFGTASLDLCQVAIGRYGLFFEYILSPWDFAAGRIIVEEAGGRVTACDGSVLPLQVSTLLASNGNLHDASLTITRRHLAS
jgi:myo-inositol-1(or 4)-monophosphatase